VTTYDDTIKALGGHYITDGDGTDYGTWTPNTVKTLIIAHDGVYVERHGKKKGELKRAAAKPSSTSKSPLRAFSHKQFGALETIVAPASMFEGVNVEAMFSEGVRLGGYYQIPDDIMPPIEQIARSLRLEREAYMSAHSGAKGDPRPLIPDVPAGARLALPPGRIRGIAEAVREIAGLPDPLRQAGTLEDHERHHRQLERAGRIQQAGRPLHVVR